jgi:hypothetical protein
MTSRKAWLFFLLCILGAAYAVVARLVILSFIASPGGVSLIRSVDHAVHFPAMRMLFGQFPYVLLLLPVTLILALLRVRGDTTLGILTLYGIIMAVTRYALLQQWSRAGMGLWFFDLFAIIVSVIVQLVLYVLIRSVVDKTASRRRYRP